MAGEGAIVTSGPGWAWGILRADRRSKPSLNDAVCRRTETRSGLSGHLPSRRRRTIGNHGRQARRWSVKKLVSLSWRARGSGATCTAEVDQAIRGFKVNPKYRSSPPGLSGPEGQTPTVSGISFDGDIYWVRLSAANGWPRSIRITQADVDGARG